MNAADIPPDDILILQKELAYLKSELRKQTEEYTNLINQLKESQDNFQFLFEHTGTANAFFNLEGYLVSQNTMSAAFLKGKPEDFKGKHIKEIFGETQGNIILERCSSVVESKEAQVYETSFFLPSGKKWFKTTYQPVWDSENSLIGIQFISQDISSEKEALEKLEESRREYSELVEITSDLITKVDSRGRFLFVNHAAYSIYGLPPKECIGRYAFEFIHPEDRERTEKSFKEWVLSDQSHFSYTNRQIHTDGSSRIMQWNISLNRNNERELVSISSIARDITEQSRLEKDLQLAKVKAEESDRLKSAFLANMSHEIRTPMNGILGFADILVREDLTEDERRRFTGIIRSSSEHLLRIISDIVDISKIESDQIDLTYSRFSLRDFFSELLSQTEIYCENRNKKQLKIQFDIIGNDTEIVTDRDRLNQILMNLLTNAVKYTDQGHILFTAEKTGNARFRFIVEDTGCGIAPEFHKIVFERFRQVKDENFDGGTGLGLAIARLLTERLGGEISLVSAVGKGSRFVFDIVSHDKLDFPLNLHTGKKVTPVADAKYKLVVAEDEAVNFQYMRTLLDKAGYTVFHAQNGREAIELAETVKPDVILMDIKMPVMNGYEALAELRKRKHTVPVIAITAYALAGDRENALEAGFDGYLTKPFLKKDLLGLLNAINR